MKGEEIKQMKTGFAQLKIVTKKGVHEQRYTMRCAFYESVHFLSLKWRKISQKGCITVVSSGREV